MNKPHKHAELIKAWADGAEIEYLFGNGRGGFWDATDCPKWHTDTQYRIKKEPKPDVVVYGRAHTAGKDVYSKVHNLAACRVDSDNLKLTFDGETGKLKAAEVLE